MASFKQVFCDSRGRDVCILEGPAVFLQAKVKRPPSLPDVSARALSTRDAVDYSLPPGRWDWVLGVTHTHTYTSLARFQLYSVTVTCIF